MHSRVKFLDSAGRPKEIGTLFVIEGKYLADCIKLQSHLKLELISTVTEANLNIYKAENSDYLCTVRDYSLIMSSQIVELLRPLLQDCADVVAIQTKPLSGYQTTNLFPQNCIIRTVSASVTLARKLDYPLLEQPNIISGVSAGGITLCVIFYAVTSIALILKLPTIIFLQLFLFENTYKRVA